MKIINDNLKKAGYFNAVLIIVAVVLRLMSLNSIHTITKIDSIVCIISLIFGLIYALNGYKKDAAKYYKYFMYLYSISSIASFIVALSGAITVLGKLGILMIIVSALMLVCIFALTFVKDLGEKKSYNFALSVLMLNIFKLIFDIVAIGPSINMGNISAGCANVVLACILCVFVSAKYKDKEARGTK